MNSLGETPAVPKGPVPRPDWAEPDWAWWVGDGDFVVNGHVADVQVADVTELPKEHRPATTMACAGYRPGGAVRYHGVDLSFSIDFMPTADTPGTWPVFSPSAEADLDAEASSRNAAVWVFTFPDDTTPDVRVSLPSLAARDDWPTEDTADTDGGTHGPSGDTQGRAMTDGGLTLGERRRRERETMNEKVDVRMFSDQYDAVTALVDAGFYPNRAAVLREGLHRVLDAPETSAEPNVVPDRYLRYDTDTSPLALLDAVETDGGHDAEFVPRDEQSSDADVRQAIDAVDSGGAGHE